MTRDPRRMTYDEIVREILGLKSDMERTTARIVELSLVLYSRIRQSPSDEYSNRYLSFANTWTRLGQMVEASLQRTSSAGRLIESVKRDKEVASDEQERQDKKARESKKAAPRQAPMPDLMELYGEEMVTNASR